MPISKKVPLKGTEHIMHPGTRAVGPIDPHELVEISVVLKNRKSLPSLTGGIKSLNHDEFAREYGADAAHVDKIRQFARENHLQVLERGDEIQRRTVTLTGTIAAMEKAFSVELTEFEYPEGTYRSHTGAIQMPEEYASIVSGVFGLDNRTVAHPHIRTAQPTRRLAPEFPTLPSHRRRSPSSMVSRKMNWRLGRPSESLN